MQTLGLVDATRKEPFTNIGPDAVSTFQDFAVDGRPLLLELEKASGEHFDFAFARSEADALLGRARAAYAEEAKVWVRPEREVGAIRRWARRLLGRSNC